MKNALSRLFPLLAGMAAFLPAGPAQAAGPTGAADRALARRIIVRKERQPLSALGEVLYRRYGLRIAAPRGVVLGARLALRPGEWTLGEVLIEAAASARCDLEVAEHRGRAVVCFWDRPDAELVKELERLARSDDETDRCTAARWLPAAGSKNTLTLALKLLADKSERVRVFAVHHVIAHHNDDLFAAGASPIPFAAPPETSRAVAAILDAKTPARKYELLRLAAILADPVFVQPLRKLLEPVYETAARRTGPNKTKVYTDVSAFGLICVALGRIGGPEAERTLLDALAKVTSHNKQYPVRGLGLLHTPTAYETLIALLDDPNLYLRRCAVFALAWRGNAQAVAPLTKLLTTKETIGNLSGAAAHALLRIGTPEAIGSVVERLRRETDVKKLPGLCMALCREPAAVDALIPHTRSDDPRTRHAAVTALGLSGSPNAVPTLLALLDHDEKNTRSRAALSLGQTGGQQAVDALIQQLATDDIDRRCSAAQAAGDAGDPRAAPAERNALKDKDPRLRALAARALGKLGGRGDVAAVLAASTFQAEKADPYDSQGQALLQLGLLGGPRAAKELLAAAKKNDAHAVQALLTSRDPDCARAARAALAAPTSVPSKTLFRRVRCMPFAAYHLVAPLLDWLRSEDAKERAAAAETLAYLNAPRAAAPLLRVAAKDQDRNARFAAVIALANPRLGGAVDPLCGDALLDVMKSDEDLVIRLNASAAMYRLGIDRRPDVAAILKALQKRRR